MKEYKNYIFDLDGTLLSSLEDLAASTNYALSKYGMNERSIEDIRHFVGNGVGKLIERAVQNGLDNPLYEDILKTFKEHYILHNLDKTKPYDGIENLLRRLHDKGKGIAIVSNKFYDATVELSRHFFPNIIDVAIGERENIRRKPAPDTVVEAMKRLGATKENTVYIGDSEVDIKTAKNCGIECISVLWGFRDKTFLEQNGATNFVSDPSEIIEFS